MHSFKYHNLVLLFDLLVKVCVGSVTVKIKHNWGEDALKLVHREFILNNKNS